MIEVVGFVYEFYVSKGQRKGDSRYAIKQAKGNQKRRKPYNEEKQVHSVGGQGLHPFETIIREEISRFDIQFFYPAFEPKTKRAAKHH